MMHDSFSLLFIPSECVGGWEGCVDSRMCGGEEGEQYEARSDCVELNGRGWDRGGKSGATGWLKGSDPYFLHFQEIFAQKCCLQVTGGSRVKILKIACFEKVFFEKKDGKISDGESSQQTLKGCAVWPASRRPLWFSAPLMKPCWQPSPLFNSPSRFPFAFEQ